MLQLLLLLLLLLLLPHPLYPPHLLHLLHQWEPGLLRLRPAAQGHLDHHHLHQLPAAVGPRRRPLPPAEHAPRLLLLLHTPLQQPQQCLNIWPSGKRCRL